MFFITDHLGSYRFHSPSVSENRKDQGVKLSLYFIEKAAQAYLLQVKGYFILVFTILQHIQMEIESRQTVEK